MSFPELPCLSCWIAMGTEPCNLSFWWRQPRSSELSPVLSYSRLIQPGFSLLNFHLPSLPPVWSQRRRFFFVLSQKWGITHQVEYAGLLKYMSWDGNALLDLGFSIFGFASTCVWHPQDSQQTSRRVEGRGNTVHVPREAHRILEACAKSPLWF